MNRDTPVEPLREELVALIAGAGVGHRLRCCISHSGERRCNLPYTKMASIISPFLVGSVEDEGEGEIWYPFRYVMKEAVRGPSALAWSIAGQQTSEYHLLCTP